MVRTDTQSGVGCGASGWSWSARLTAGIPALLCAFVWVDAGAAAGEGQTPQGPTQDQAPIPLYGEPLAPEVSTPWLDEVRAQRRSWEEKRNAARSAYEARRRANNPKAAAQQEAWEEDVQRRRSARHERMEQERELYRSLGPSLLPAWPWPNQGPNAGPDALTQDPTWDPTRRADAIPGPFAPAPPGEVPLYAPPGWDNRWYFRGF